MAEHNQQFDTYDEWLAKGELWTRRVGLVERPICFDTKKRICNGSVGFARARDDAAFPVRWLWPSQIPEIIDRAENVAIAHGMGWETDLAIDNLVAILPGVVEKQKTRGAA